MEPGLVEQESETPTTSGTVNINISVMLFVSPVQCMALDRYKITWVYVCLSEIPIGLASDRRFCTIFLKFM